MKVLVTGASGRVRRAIYIRLCSGHAVLGYDQAPSSTADIVASLEDTDRLRRALEGVNAVVHTAALHAPHVGLCSEAEFERVHVHCTAELLRLSLAAGIRRFVFTSTTALYGAAATPPGQAGWTAEDTVPQPRTIYHRTKLQAENLLEAAAGRGELEVTVLRMSRCFSRACAPHGHLPLASRSGRTRCSRCPCCRAGKQHWRVPQVHHFRSNAVYTRGLQGSA